QAGQAAPDPGGDPAGGAEEGQDHVGLQAAQPGQAQPGCREDEQALLQGGGTVLAAAQPGQADDVHALADFIVGQAAKAGGEHADGVPQGSELAGELGAGIASAGTDRRVFAVDNQNVHLAIP